MATTLETLHGLRNELKTATLARNKAEFIAKGGCQTCWGWGVLLTWSTLDGPSWDETGACTNPACTAKESGRCPGTAYPSSGGFGNVIDPAYSPEELTVLEEIEKEIEALNAIEAAIADEKKVRKGSEIKVVAGRKVPIGTTGRVFWTGNTAYGVRCGFNDASGATHWTAIKNVEVVL